MSSEKPKVVVHSEHHGFEGGKQKRIRTLVTVRDSKSYFAPVELGDGEVARQEAAVAGLSAYVHDGCAPTDHAWHLDGDTYRCHGCAVTFPVNAVPNAMASALNHPRASNL